MAMLDTLRDRLPVRAELARQTASKTIVTLFPGIALAAVLAAGMLVPDVTADPQPKMRSALDNLRSAERALEKASHDKGGHRAKALTLTREAIEEVQRGIKFDNRH